MAENPVTVMKRFHISEKYGFMLEDPLESLPEYFAKWDKLGKNCAELLLTKKLREEISKLELLDVKQLKGYRQHRLAYMYLSFLANGYVWQGGNEGVSKILPKQIAIPLCTLADYLGTKPAFTYTSLCLGNYRLLDKNRSAADIGNLQTICQFPGGEEFDWFTKKTILLEIACAPAIKAMLELIQAVDERLDVSIVAYLKKMTQTLVAFKEISSGYHEKTTGHGFFHVFRPFFVGWGGTDSLLPDGLIYDGVSDNPIKVYGANASQSSTIPCFDAALGMEYEKEIY